MAGPRTAIDVAAEIARHLAHLSGSSDALAFIANQAEIAALAMESGAAASRLAARMQEVSAVAALHASGAEYPTQPCEQCAGPMFAFESFCKSCGYDPAMVATYSAPQASAEESGTYTVDP